ncbi:MSHA biogenesis protein MshO [Betaproteobacteria bacterium]|nr:MSHA biogenesis protein MshO [Betaproteobacteria bacterium]
MRRRVHQGGFTLVEAIMVIVITGIVAGMVALFIRAPINAYLDSERRAMLTDIADTAARRIARDIQSAVPNSVRVDATGNFLEFVPVLTGGRYRASVGPGAAGDPLDFNSPDSRFDVLGPPIDIPAGAGANLVIFNQGTDESNVYRTRTAVTPGVGLSTVDFASATLTAPSPGHRFQIAGTPVTYACDPGTGTLWRYAGYGFQVAQPTSALGAGVPLATRLASCRFAYADSALQNNALVSMFLSFSQEDETVTLQHQVNVDNVP